MNLTTALARRADRGPHRQPGDVIAAAQAQHRLDASTDRSDRRTPMPDVPLTSPDSRPARLRPALVGLTAAAVVGVGIAAAFTQRTSTPAEPAAATEPPAAPLELTGQQQNDVIDRCASGDTPTDAIVDARTSGILVGLTIDGMWRTCLYASSPSGDTLDLANSVLPAPETPLSLLPETSPQWPITVIDAKVPDGNDINGDEMTWVWGRIDPSIATITITTPTGAYTPTLHNGLFAASWPGNNGDRTVVHGFDTSGAETAFTDQLNCAALEPVETGAGLFTPMQPRLVIGNEYIGGGCLGGQDVPPGQSPDDIGD